MPLGEDNQACNMTADASQYGGNDSYSSGGGQRGEYGSGATGGDDSYSSGGGRSGVSGGTSGYGDDSTGYGGRGNDSYGSSMPAIPAHASLYDH